MEYVLKSYLSVDELINDGLHRLSSYHWEAPAPYRPETFANVGIVNGSLVAVLKCYEENPRTECYGRDEPVYTDSCLELFVAPVSTRKEYINVECNSKGVFLCEFGEGKYNRALSASVTRFSPLVESFYGCDGKGSFWGVYITLTKNFIADVYKVELKDINFDLIRLNFYKCGDGCAVPHYLAFSPVTTLPPGFHNPDCFVKFKKENL